MKSAILVAAACIGIQFVSAAPVPKEPENADAKALVGMWRYKSEEGAMASWGTAVATFAADGKFSATFNMPGGGTGLFADMSGTHRMTRDTLFIAYVQNKGAKGERKVDVEYRVSFVDHSNVRMAFELNGVKRSFILERVEEKKSDIPPKK